MRTMTSVTPKNGGEFIIVPEMRNGMLVWREVKAN